MLRGRPLASGRVSTEDEGGVIKVLPPGGSPPRIFLDITARVLAGSEQGLLGQPDGATVIAEYRASAGDPNVADPTEAVFLVIAQPFTNHNGGMVEFGPGFLYIGMGDGGAGNDPGNRAQDINQLLGKMLRIDVDHPNGAQPYSSPPSNPFFGSVAGADEIYAYGFRNP